MTKFYKEDTIMSINPAKLKQYISLKEAAITLRPDFAVDCNDPKPDSNTATISILLSAPFLLEGETKTAFAALYTFSDIVVINAGSEIQISPEPVRFTFGVDCMQKEE